MERFAQTRSIKYTTIIDGKVLFFLSTLYLKDYLQAPEASSWFLFGSCDKR